MTDNLTDVTGNPRWSDGSPLRFTLGLNARIMPSQVGAHLIRDTDLQPEIVDTIGEMASQVEKWGEQNHPNGTGPDAKPLNLDAETFVEYDTQASILADVFTESTDYRAKGGTITWLDILLEEVFEAAAEQDLEKLDTELKQVAAVTLSWRRAIVRQKLAAPADLGELVGA